MQRSVGLAAVALLLSCAPPVPVETIVTAEPRFESVQPELFAAYGAQPNAWADYDNDGDLDLYVGFRYSPNRLYKNDDGVFRDVAAEVGLNVTDDTRVASWGDFDADGLHVGLPQGVTRVDVEVTSFGRAGRMTTLVEDVDASKIAGRVLRVVVQR